MGNMNENVFGSCLFDRSSLFRLNAAKIKQNSEGKLEEKIHTHTQTQT